MKNALLITLRFVWELICYVLIPLAITYLIILCYFNPDLRRPVEIWAVKIVGSFTFTILFIHALGYFNLFFTLRRQERAVYRMGGTELIDVLITSNRFVQDEDYNLKLDPKAAKAANKNRNIILKLARVNWIGLPFLNSILWTNQTWSRWEEDEKSCLHLNTHVAQPTPYLFLSDTDYGFDLDGIEDIDGNLLRIKGSFFVHPVNTYRPIFDTNGYLHNMTDHIVHKLRLMSKQYEYISPVLRDIHKKLKGKKSRKKAPIGSIHSQEFCDAVVKHLKTEFAEQIGFNLIAITISDVALQESDEQKKILDAAGDVKVAELKKQKTVTDAEASRDARILAGEGEGKYRKEIADGEEKLTSAVRKGLSKDDSASPEVVASVKNAPYFPGVRTVTGEGLNILLSQRESEGNEKPLKTTKP